MKPITCLYRFHILIAALLLSIAVASQTKVDSDIFKSRCSMDHSNRLSVAITKSDTIPLDNMGTIYALSIDAAITQPREASHVSIVLEDIEGHNYLVAESDRFRNDTSTVQLTQYCEETALLAGIIPSCLKCYVAEGATISVTGIHTSCVLPMRGTADMKAASREQKQVQVQDIVARINDYNVRHGKLWRAAANAFTLKSIDEQRITGEGNAYSANMIYYEDGIYEIGERDEMRTSKLSDFVESFDWRNRHGKNWITPVKNQVYIGPCPVFAAVGMTEALTNLYFNNSTLNRDLSEEFIICYKYQRQLRLYPGLIPPIQFLVTDSVIDENSCAYGSNWDYTNPRPVGNEAIRLSGTKPLYKSGLSYDDFSDSLKYNLIHYGPGAWGGDFPGYSNSANHYMTLVGWGTAHSGDTCTIISSYSTNTMIIPSTMSGKTYWIMKNSFGNNEAHYMKIIFNDPTMYYDACFAQTPVLSRKLNDGDIVSEDMDGDGYYNWGISDNPPVPLPSWAYSEKDADDSNRFISTMDDRGKPNYVDYEGLEYISSYTCVNSDSINYKHIIIENGGTLDIKGYFHCFPGVCVSVKTGGTLTIDGGVLKNIHIDVESNSTINIINGGQLILLPQDEDELIYLPQTAKLNLLEGNITKCPILYVPN